MPARAQRGSRGIALLILDLRARRGWVVSTTPRPLYPRERPITLCIGGWVGSRAGLDVCEKSRPHWDFFFDPRTVQPVASRYTDWVTGTTWRRTVNMTYRLTERGNQGTPLTLCRLTTYILVCVCVCVCVCRTAPLTSRRCILNIYSTNIRTEYFKHAV
jgi:hypothetical protein